MDSCRISRVPHYSGAVLDSNASFAYGAFTRCGALFQVLRLDCCCLLLTVLQPRRCLDTAGLGCCAFARHYLRNHCCFLFLRVLRCFSSRVSPALCAVPRGARRVAPFGNPCLSGYLPLGTAYRSLSRPSSPPRAKASFMCPFLLSVYLSIPSRIRFSPFTPGCPRGAAVLSLCVFLG